MRGIFCTRFFTAFAALGLVACAGDTTGPPGVPPTDLSTYSGAWDVKAAYWFSGSTNEIGLDGEFVDKPGTVIIVTGELDVGEFRDVRQEMDPVTGATVTSGVAPGVAEVRGGRTCTHSEELEPIDCRESFQLRDWSDPWVGLEVTRSPAGEDEVVLRITMGGRESMWDAHLHQDGDGLFVGRPGVEHPDSLGWMLRRPR